MKLASGPWNEKDKVVHVQLMLIFECANYASFSIKTVNFIKVIVFSERQDKCSSFNLKIIINNLKKFRK